MAAYGHTTVSWKGEHTSKLTSNKWSTQNSSFYLGT